MRRVLFAAVAALPLLLHSNHSNAQYSVNCINCSSIYEQLVSDARQAQQFATQVDQYTTQLKQYANMVTNTVALPEMVWSNITNDIMQVRSLANQASLLAGNSGSILTRLQTAGAYGSQMSMTGTTMSNQFAMWQQTLANVDQSLGRTLGMQQGQMQNYSALQASIQMHGQTATGQMQALQASVEMAGLTNSQLQQMQATLTAQSQMQAAHMMADADRRAQEDAAMQEFVSGSPVPTTGYQGF